MSAEVGKSSWVIGAVTGFLFVIGAATSTLGFLKSVEDRADAAQPQPAAPVQPPAASPSVQRIEVALAEPRQAEPRSVEPSVAPPEVSMPAPAPVALPTARIEPSFDCSRAETFTEHSVCGSSELALMDQRMAGLYRSARNVTVISGMVREEQRIWLRARELCENEVCLKVAYEERIGALRRQLGGI